MNIFEALDDKLCDSPLVTVIIPTIGRPEYIVDALRSILLQTYRHLQIIISDNAPSQPTAALIAAEGIADTRITIVERVQRLDFSTHMNACFELAQGVFVMILSDDDQISSDYISDMLALLRQYPDISLCLGRQIQINQNDRGVMFDTTTHKTHEIFDGIHFLKDTHSGNLKTGVLTNFSMLVRLRDIQILKGFKNYPYGFHVDNFVLLSLALEGKVALTSGPMYYRVYLESSGLSAPFSALLQATVSYTADCAALIRQKTEMSLTDRKVLISCVRSSNTRMLVGRLRRIYASKLSAFAILSHLIEIAKYRFAKV